MGPLHWARDRVEMKVGATCTICGKYFPDYKAGEGCPHPIVVKIGEYCDCADPMVGCGKGGASVCYVCGREYILKK